MKTSAVLASALLSAFAVAAPVDKRALVYHTEIVTETVVVYTTIYDDDDVVPAATSTSEGLFYEQPSAVASSAATSSVVVVPSEYSAAPAPAPAPSSKAQESSSVYTPPAPTPAPPTPAPQPEEPKPTTTEQPYVAPSPAPVTTSAAPIVQSPAPVASPQPASAGSASTGGGDFSNVDITIYDNAGGYGACGTQLHDSDMIVALAQPAWGTSTYNVMTGEATNPWCGQKIKVDYNGNSIEATIMDLCPGCVGHDIDLSLAAWKALTGLDEKTRLKASWSKIA